MVLVPYRKLMDVNVASREIRRLRRVLLYGTCVRDEYPSIFETYAEGRVPLAVCMEETHFNLVALKLASMAIRVKLEELVVLTVDGSPHCIQLHMAVEEVDKIVGGLPRKHVVVEEGRAHEIEPEYVRIARYLTKVRRLAIKSKHESTLG
ncbi:MAG: 4Fe-4S ferredoxin [Thermoprotei archaeon]|nr:MAG: 4Fe-4S ferredoxin [Thermoprotei archaeon]